MGMQNSKDAAGSSSAEVTPKHKSAVSGQHHARFALEAQTSSVQRNESHRSHKDSTQSAVMNFFRNRVRSRSSADSIAMANRKNLMLATSRKGKGVIVENGGSIKRYELHITKLRKITKTLHVVPNQGHNSGKVQQLVFWSLVT